jgi:hybrid polyketide synthase / nonribosomal peptide synthetase ACE1
VMKGPNFTSTKELVKLAAARTIPVHFISSAGVVELIGSDVKTTEASMANFHPPVDGTSGYIASKWASEVYIEKASKTLGLPVHIHRVMPAVNQSGPINELLQDFLEVADRMRVVPDWNGWGGSCDVINANNLATKISNSAVEGSSGDSSVICPLFIHHVCEGSLQMADIEKFVNAQSDDRSSFEMAAPHAWAGKAKKAGLGYHFGTMEFHISGQNGSGQLDFKR